MELVHMAAENGRELPPMTRVFQETHQKKDGSFMDEQSEQVYNEAMARIAECQAQVSPDVPLTIVEQDFEQVAPKKRNRILGMGSIADCLIAMSSRIHEDPVVLRQQLKESHTEISNLRTEQVVQREEIQTARQKIHEMSNLFDIIAASMPSLDAALKKKQMLRRRQQEEQQHQEEVGASRSRPQGVASEDGNPSATVNTNSDLSIDDFVISSGN
ncbi:uncharacterized protein LOC112083087 [Eutrema salsugineum]|uniref:uncharacterized protein LOC112083087 n=1 Tax=Eutrema salsugineum TaxID=72664 RepID=UPI000CECFF12|nr:uncharacterized protein LOC112083087 [Eutrema salsugineum]